MDNKQQIFVSPDAIKNIKLQLDQRNIDNSYLRIGVRGGSCAGYSYFLEFGDNNISDKDLIFNFDDIKIIVDKKSILYLNGSTLEYKKTLLEKGYYFNNPNAQSHCGCGSSFSYKENK